MNAAIRAAIFRSRSYCSPLQTARFHSTPVLERKRRPFWEPKSSVHQKRFRRMREKQDLLRNANAFADRLFGEWRGGYDEDDHTSWFKKHYGQGSKRNRRRKHSPEGWSNRLFEFCEDGEEFEMEHVFRSAFGGSRGFFWSFTHEEDEPDWKQSYRHSSNFRRSRKSRFRNEYEEEDGYSSTDQDRPNSNQASHRLTLGLSASGPLDLEDVKNAYRTCALKWHPDRHQGPAKAVAEEKFKLCSAAYQSLCDKLAISIN